MDTDQLVEMLANYATPSESYWRAFEMEKLLELKAGMGFPEPVLEVGCGSGAFTKMLFTRVATAVDINPRAVERAKTTGVYGDVHCMDAAHMAFPSGVYGTVFANCVLEHIPAMPRVLSDAFRVLRPGGRLVATVPLLAMNDYLMVRNEAYAALRRGQLAHVNLLSEGGWRNTLCAVGFGEITFHPYLYGDDVRLWDVLDFPASIGVGRYRVSTAIRQALKLVPTALRDRARHWSAAALLRVSPQRGRGEPCAAALIATKG